MVCWLLAASAAELLHAQLGNGGATDVVDDIPAMFHPHREAIVAVETRAISKVLEIALISA